MTYMCNNTVAIWNIKWLENLKIREWNVYFNNYYLSCKQRSILAINYRFQRYVPVSQVAVSFIHFSRRPASWSSGQSFWLLITRSCFRFPPLPWDFPCGERIPVVTMVWVVSIIRFKVEISLTRSHTSIKS